jgi:hypothetical protein
MTIACLLRNTLAAACAQHGIDPRSLEAALQVPDTTAQGKES